jgi:hypothetical protein
MDFLPEGKPSSWFGSSHSCGKRSQLIPLLYPAVFGFRGLLDDILVFIAAYVYIYLAYRAILVARHAA